jgi:hypothetical protein
MASTVFSVELPGTEDAPNTSTKVGEAPRVVSASLAAGMKTQSHLPYLRSKQNEKTEIRKKRNKKATTENSFFKTTATRPTWYEPEMDTEITYTMDY